ncbi:MULTISPECIES: hypothetical protein [unclassified Actinobaculum]|nr:MULTISPECIES: hypothetical protein [unclassified Actinobaculum]
MNSKNARPVNARALVESEYLVAGAFQNIGSTIYGQIQGESSTV